MHIEHEEKMLKDGQAREDVAGLSGLSAAAELGSQWREHPWLPGVPAFFQGFRSSV